MPKLTPTLLAKRTMLPAGSTVLYLPAISVRALNVMRFPATAAVTPNRFSLARKAAYPPRREDSRRSYAQGVPPR